MFSRYFGNQSCKSLAKELMAENRAKSKRIVCLIQDNKAKLVQSMATPSKVKKGAIC